mmetsp:Transcript_38282/g.46738  ORF Transcript_38282/g.46738 Transcript_38282/m.46738 type:complete len:274 (-) Transcript_38282:68-889(-)
MTIKASPHQWDDDSTSGDTTETLVATDTKEHVSYLNGKIKVLNSYISDLRAEKDKINEEKCRLIVQVEQLQYDIQKERREHENELKRIMDEKSVTLKNLPKPEVNESTAMVGKANAVWRRTMNNVAACNNFFRRGMIDVLECPVLREGIHKWRIRLERVGGIRLGVISSEHDIDYGKPLGDQEGTWGYGGFGDAWYGAKNLGYFAKYDREECLITMILDLDGCGSLSYAIDHNPAVVVFKNMKSKLRNSSDFSGFLPAANLSVNAKIRFLGFE